jgi:hypothetical protein
LKARPSSAFIVDGVATFQLQFTWDLYTERGIGHQAMENGRSVSSTKRHFSARQRSIRLTKDKDTTANLNQTSNRARDTPEDDVKLRQLRKKELSWLAIAAQFLGRSPGAIEVRYHTKLKTDPIAGLRNRMMTLEHHRLFTMLEKKSGR